MHPNAPQSICCVPGTVPDPYALFLLLFKHFSPVIPAHCKRKENNPEKKILQSSLNPTTQEWAQWHVGTRLTPPSFTLLYKVHLNPVPDVCSPSTSLPESLWKISTWQTRK